MSRSQWLTILLPLVLAAALAAFIVSNSPDTSLAIFVGAMVLIVAFLSTPASLYILVFSMLLSPEFMVGGLGGGGGASGRGITLRFDDFLLVVIGFVWLAKMAIMKEKVPFWRTPLNGPIMAYIAAAVLATLVGALDGRVKPMTGFFYVLKYYEYVFIYFMVVNSVTSRTQAKRLVIASLVTCFLVSLFAIAQIPSGERASAPFEGENGEPNTLGGYLVFMMAVVTGLIMTEGAMPRRFPLLVFFATAAIGLSATLSRSSFLAAFVVFLIVLGRTVVHKPILAPILLIVLLSAPWWAPEAVRERILYTFTQSEVTGQMVVAGIKVDTSTSDRLRSWQTSLTWWQQFPIVGTGVTGGPFMDAMYPRVITETGTVGIAAFLFLLASIFRVGFAAYRRAADPFDRGLALGFLFGYVGVLTHAVGANSFLIVRMMEPFWLIAALVVRGFMIESTIQSAEREVPTPSAYDGKEMRLKRPAFGKLHTVRPLNR